MARQPSSREILPKKQDPEFIFFAFRSFFLGQPTINAIFHLLFSMNRSGLKRQLTNIGNAEHHSYASANTADGSHTNKKGKTTSHSPPSSTTSNTRKGLANSVLLGPPQTQPTTNIQQTSSIPVQSSSSIQSRHTQPPATTSTAMPDDVRSTLSSSHVDSYGGDIRAIPSNVKCSDTPSCTTVPGTGGVVVAVDNAVHR